MEQVKQTAVEWLIEQIGEMYLHAIYNEEFEQAKAMFEEQIIDAHIAGFYSEPFGKSRTGEAKHYYKTTFKSE